MRRIFIYSVLIFQIILIISLVRGIQLSKRTSTRIANLQETRDKLLTEQEELKQQGEYVQSTFYLEKVAREELHLSKPGESVVIVSDEYRSVEPGNQRAEEGEEKKNWQKWWEVLSGSE